MEFWGVKVKPGKPVKVEGEFDTLLHICQAALGDCKGKKGKSVSLYVKVRNQKFLLGILHTENIPQLSWDLVFEKEIELSHNWAGGSVYFTGFKSPNYEEEDCFDSEEEKEEAKEVTATITDNGNAAKAVAKPESADDDEEDDSDSEEGMDVDEDDSDDDEDSEEEEEKTPTPKKPESSKKRANEAAPKTPVSAKKAKASPQKTEEKKKGGHTATPHPAKKGGNTPASQVSCGSCKKTFNSEKALESHSKSKHSAAK